MMRKTLILGATSLVAERAALKLAGPGASFVLAARDLEACRAAAANLGLRTGARTQAMAFDATDTSSHSAFLDRVIAFLGGLDLVIILTGAMGEDPASLDPRIALPILQTNFIGLVSILGLVATQLETQGHGSIVCAGSVAGDRGRQSNFVYGSAKGGLALYLQGLRNRLSAKGIRVITMKFGFLDTAMTFGKRGIFAAASPEAAGTRLVNALDKGSDIVYYPGFWRLIMFIIRLIPEPIFKRMKL